MNVLPWPGELLSDDALAGAGAVLSRCAEALSEDRLPATLMLVGEPGLGREALALRLAAMLICRAGGRPDCACHACDRVRRGVHPDLEVLDVSPGRTEIRIEQVRELLDGANRVPYEGTRRVIVVASCHTPPLNTDSGSALLKILEEPPSHLSFLLLASNPRRVLGTIASRAVQLRIPPPPPAIAARLLATLHGVDEAVIRALFERIGDDAALLVHGADATLADTVDQIDEVVADALAGDGFAIVRLAGLAKQSAWGVPLVARVLLRNAAAADVESAEAFLDAAAALIAADHRRAVLHLDIDHVVATTLAATARGTH